MLWADAALLTVNDPAKFKPPVFKKSVPALPIFSIGSLVISSVLAIEAVPENVELPADKVPTVVFPALRFAPTVRLFEIFGEPVIVIVLPANVRALVVFPMDVFPTPAAVFISVIPETVIPSCCIVIPPC